MLLLFFAKLKFYLKRKQIKKGDLSEIPRYSIMEYLPTGLIYILYHVH